MDKHNPFKTSLAHNIFRNKYALNHNETWRQRAITIVDSVCGAQGGTLHPILSQSEREQLVEYIAEMKFIPGGRYVYYAGREAKFWNNCGVGSTRVMTDTGWVRMDECVGQTRNVLSPVDGKFYPATFHAHGKQPTRTITFAPVRGRSTITYSVTFTPDHKWALKDGSTTEELKVGDVVPANQFAAGEDDLGFAHGFVFGDGNRKGQLRLCAEKDKAHLARLMRVGPTLTYPPFAKGDPLLYFKNPVAWKEAPPKGASPAYIASFIRGWIAADGCDGHILSSVNQEALEWFRAHAAYAGIVISGMLRSQVRDVVIGDYEYKNHTIYNQNYAEGAAWAGFKVISIEDAGEQEVYCPYEPVHNQIVIDHGIHTYQCYLLRAEHDTREQWAETAGYAMACLTAGGGIGVDYSALRPAGRTLRRTGGLSSGPIPLMLAINEIGRNVMQGGSRRSAIYGSLNWQHEDAPEFLKAKNWSDMPVGSTGQTLKDIKAQDFNFPCPLDMTNISLNYDDAWLNDKERAHHPTFLANVKQAMSTGEPGFSFNFGDKQNETLRNACTEVTSEDDSDVCNLGSVNMGNIESLEEFKEVVALASKFLVCGTVRAELPYEKVKQVREKNRRLGLGLMGIHEWLLKRKMKYEVTPELHKWLEVYQNESKKAADEHCDRLYLSRPVAYRAIAPTGSIGILASTTTGIEPLYAVAYKRRYLVDGTRWKYEFVVDATADHLIQTYGIDPDKIESAADLAANPEQRMKFQAEVQDYVDMAISSTINLPAWETEGNNEEAVHSFAKILSKYAPRLRGFTCYPDGARGGQPITVMPYEEAKKHKGVVYEESDICSISGKGGVCGA